MKEAWAISDEKKVCQKIEENIPRHLSTLNQLIVTMPRVEYEFA
jgi:hypothetical protein